MPRGKTYDSVNGTIGETPMVCINRLVPSEHATVFAKCEFFQPLNSVKDRIVSRCSNTRIAALGDVECGQTLPLWV